MEQFYLVSHLIEMDILLLRYWKEIIFKKNIAYIHEEQTQYELWLIHFSDYAWWYQQQRGIKSQNLLIPINPYITLY